MSSGVLLVLLAAAAAQIPPVDQCASDPSFVQFRSDLTRTIAARDRDKLIGMVANDVLASLGGHIGRSEFEQLWALDQPGESSVWKELEAVLGLGCSNQGGVPTAPSLGAQLTADRDPFETFVALPRAVLRSRASDDSTVVERLRWDVLTQKGEWDGGAWVEVRLDDGRSGYVRRDQVRSPIDYRAWFQRTGGRWKIAGFVAGD